MNKAARYWNRTAERYSKSPVSDEDAYRKKLEKTREYLNTDMDVFEFGCGTGSTAIVHAPYVKHIYAIDLSSKMIEIARAKTEAAGIDNITYSCVSVDAADIRNESMDVVLGLSILHLLDDWHEAITRIHDILKRGGIFVSSTVCLGDSMGFMRPVLRIGYLLGFLPPVSVFKTTQLEQALTESGFEVEYRWQPGRNKGVFIIARKVG